ncbi:VRR-NUC domain protein [Paenibacillus curdlanolyticus YK9]|uniref:VRR-NUC domain protein n=1 Tax=Paenibacillus curdlanolyticus YK9 TaxID=717606 RepID=E0IBS2_9BACL|nr:VRR-NUC domain-containing protein [Paenibacillus curdlanolyticus]EFM10152.1 VRR-NUC domain protein [Paenibacillus curdlanolyticus YK9]
MRERDIETYLREKVRAAGGKAYKWTSPGNAGVPDRIVMLPGGRVAFVELKAPGKKATPLQVNQQRTISNLGLPVTVIDSKAGADAFISRMQAAGGLPTWPEQ